MASAKARIISFSLVLLLSVLVVVAVVAVAVVVGGGFVKKDLGRTPNPREYPLRVAGFGSVFNVSIYLDRKKKEGRKWMINRYVDGRMNEGKNTDME